MCPQSKFSVVNKLLNKSINLQSQYAVSDNKVNKQTIYHVPLCFLVQYQEAISIYHI